MHVTGTSGRASTSMGHSWIIWRQGCTRGQHASITHQWLLDDGLFPRMQVLLSLNHSCVYKEQRQLPVNSLKNLCHQSRFPVLGSSCLNSTPSRDVSWPACSVRRKRCACSQRSTSSIPLARVQGKATLCSYSCQNRCLVPEVGAQACVEACPHLTERNTSKPSSESSP